MSVLHKCDLALKAQKEVSDLQAAIIAQQEDLIKHQQNKIDTSQIWKPLAIGAVGVVILESLILVIRK